MTWLSDNKLWIEALYWKNTLISEWPLQSTGRSPVSKVNSISVHFKRAKMKVVPSIRLPFDTKKLAWWQPETEWRNYRDMGIRLEPIPKSLGRWTWVLVRFRFLFCHTSQFYFSLACVWTGMHSRFGLCQIWCCSSNFIIRNVRQFYWQAWSLSGMSGCIGQSISQKPQSL